MKTKLILLTALIALVCAIPSHTLHSQDAPGWHSLANWRRIQPGMTLTRVEQILGPRTRPYPLGPWSSGPPVWEGGVPGYGHMAGSVHFTSVVPFEILRSSFVFPPVGLPDDWAYHTDTNYDGVVNAVPSVSASPSTITFYTSPRS